MKPKTLKYLCGVESFDWVYNVYSKMIDSEEDNSDYTDVMKECLEDKNVVLFKIREGERANDQSNQNK